MKTVAVIFLVVFSVAGHAQITKSAAANKHQNNLKSSGPKAKIKKETSYTFISKAVSSALSPEWAYRSEFYFNKHGKIIRMVFFNDFKTKRVSEQRNYLYDAEGREIKTIGKDGRIISSSVFSRDNNGKLKATVSSRTGDSFKLTYNSLGKPDTRYNYTISGKLSGKTIYRYDRRGNLLEEISYEATGELKGNNNVSGKLGGKTIYRYDRRGNLLEEISYKATGELKRKKQFRYDDQNNKIEEVYFELTQVQGKRTSKYDKYGNVIQEIDSGLVYVGGPPGVKIGPDTYSRTYKYLGFDKYGNWVEQHLLLKGKTVRRVRREIEYFE